MDHVDRIKRLENELNKYFVNYESVVRLVILSLASRVPVILVGPPGTAKTTLFRVMEKLINAKTFIVSLNEQMPVDFLFGPIDYKELRENSKIIRKWREYLPGADIVILDELFRMPRAIASSLLMVLADGMFYDGEKIVKAKTWNFYGTTNFNPMKIAGKNGGFYRAFVDRFPLRIEVPFVPRNKLREAIRASIMIDKLLLNGTTPIASLDDFKKLYKEVSDIVERDYDKIGDVIDSALIEAPIILKKHSTRTLVRHLPRLIAAYNILYGESYETAADAIITALANEVAVSVKETYDLVRNIEALISKIDSFIYDLNAGNIERDEALKKAMELARETYQLRYNAYVLGTPKTIRASENLRAKLLEMQRVIDDLVKRA